MRHLIIPIALGLLACGCSKRSAAPPPAPAAEARAAAAAPAPTTIPTAAELGDGPSEAQLRQFMERRNEALEAMRRDPALAPQLPPFHLKIYELRKDKCTPMPAWPGKLECGVDMKVTMWPVGGRESGPPLADSKSLDVTRNARGEWVDCAVGPEAEPACAYNTGPR